MSQRSTPKQILRFLLVGGINTVATYTVFFALALVLPVEIAYTIAFVVGLAWVVLGSSRVVFGGRHSVLRLTLFAVAYIVIYLVGRLVIAVVDPQDQTGLMFLTLALIAATAPLSFLAGKLILTARLDPPDDAKDRLP